MREEWARVEQLAPVDTPPLIGRAIGAIALRRQRMRRRAETEDVEQQSFVVALPAVGNESVLRSPAVSQRRSAIACPVPVSPSVQEVGKAADLRLVGRVAVEVGANRERASEKKCRIYRRKLALPDP